MVKFAIEGAKSVNEHIWTAQIDPRDVRVLGSSAVSYGAVSVIIVMSPPSGGDGRVEFEPRDAHVANVGTSPETLIVFQPSVERPAGSIEDAGVEAARFQKGDQAFLDALPPGFAPLGGDLLGRVRREFSGDLVFHSQSGKYVQSPDNFWTVKIQPHARSLRITVRGNPHEFRAPPGIDLKGDMHGYSVFTITQASQLDGALSIVRQARKK